MKKISGIKFNLDMSNSILIDFVLVIVKRA